MLTRARAHRRIKVSLWCHNSPRRNAVTGCGWRHALEARGGLCEIWRKWESGTRRQTRRIDFWSSQARGELVPYGGGALETGAKWIRQHRRLSLSSLRRNLQLKVNKKVSYLKKNRYVFSNSGIPMFFICSIVMNIICPFRTWPYSCRWLCNSLIYIWWIPSHTHPHIHAFSFHVPLISVQNSDIPGISFLYGGICSVMVSIELLCYYRI